MTLPAERPAPSAVDRVPAPALVLVAIGSVQLGSAVAKSLFDDAGATGVVLMRVGFGALVVLALLRPRFTTWSRQALLAAALLGVAMGTMNLVFYLSIQTVPLGIAVTVEFLGPLLLSLVQTRRWLDVSWVLLAGAGVALLGLDGGSAPLGGLALAFLAGVCWAAYILLSARVGALVPGTGGLAGALVVATLVVLPFGAASLARVVDQPAVLAGGLAVAVLSSVVPYGAELAALRRIPTRVFGVLMSLEPAAAALAGFVVLGQRLHPREVLALLLVTAASAGVTLTARRSREVPAQPLE